MSTNVRRRIQDSWVTHILSILSPLMQLFEKRTNTSRLVKIHFLIERLWVNNGCFRILLFYSKRAVTALVNITGLTQRRDRTSYLPVTKQYSTNILLRKVSIMKNVICIHTHTHKHILHIYVRTDTHTYRPIY